MTDDPAKLIAFQGIEGAYSNMACLAARPDLTPLPCPTFEEAFQAVTSGRADLAMIPIENSVAGRVADIHHLLPDSGLSIVGEHFERIRHQLLGPPGASLASVRRVHSHVHALAQCRTLLRDRGYQAVVAADTAGAAAEVAARGDPADGAIASTLAAETYGLSILAPDVEDADHNTTRFVLMAREPIDIEPAAGPVITTFVFKVRNIPAALYKALGGFATNGVNMLKLESYLLGASFNAAQFYVDVAGHPDEPAVHLALQELGFFSKEVKVLGVYAAHPYRAAMAAA